ncbi:hypothetical protein AMS68_004778 [Peltaster fructicola]|uniref:Carbonic anhydrase n=1 Tax=Peltaster fructicola TaxID=286661 RepID=A0A6H0XX74_9PEZI|nr:hypothetical protein AMS68_004778 [Peltaster fructicola]
MSGTTGGALTAALESNQKWASNTASSDPEFFPKCAKGQTPKILWLGCSDSRVPETTVLGLKPGDVFVHRNIANIMNPTDTNMLSVVEYSVRYLKVEQIVVCGHSSCGGVAATLANGKLGVIDVWLQPMRALREKHAAELSKLDGAAKAAALGKLNVQAGVDVIKRIPTVIEAIKERGLTVHGAIYHLDSGKVEELDCKEDEAAGTTRSDAFALS